MGLGLFSAKFTLPEFNASISISGFTQTIKMIPSALYETTTIYVGKSIGE